MPGNLRALGVLIVSGPPGAGKTTVSRALVESGERCVHLKTDLAFDALGAGRIEPWLPESDAQNRTVTRAMAASAREFALGSYFVVVDGVALPPMLALYSETLGAEVDFHYVVLLPSVDEVVARGLARAEAPEALTEAVFREMHRQFVAADIRPRHIIDTTRSTAHWTVAEILRRLEVGNLRTAG